MSLIPLEGAGKQAEVWRPNNDIHGTKIYGGTRVTEGSAQRLYRSFYTTVTVRQSGSLTFKIWQKLKVSDWKCWKRLEILD